MARNRAVCRLGKAYIVRCRLNVALVQTGVAGLGHHLVNAAAGHDVAAQEQPDRTLRLPGPERWYRHLKNYGAGAEPAVSPSRNEVRTR